MSVITVYICYPVYQEEVIIRINKELSMPLVSAIQSNLKFKAFPATIDLEKNPGLIKVQ